MYDFGFCAMDILQAVAEDSGTYEVRATNRVGTATSSITIEVKREYQGYNLYPNCSMVNIDLFYYINDYNGHLIVEYVCKTCLNHLICSSTAKSDFIIETQHPEAMAQITRLEQKAPSKRPEDAVVIEKPHFGRSLRNQEHLIEGQAVHMEATLTPVNDPTMKVEWFFNGQPIPSGNIQICFKMAVFVLSYRLFLYSPTINFRLHGDVFM